MSKTAPVNIGVSFRIGNCVPILSADAPASADNSAVNKCPWRFGGIISGSMGGPSMFPRVYVRLITIRVIIILAAGWLLPLLFLPTGFGQNRGGATPPSTGTPPGNTGTPAPTTGTGTGRTPTTIPNNTNNPNPQASLPQPIFVSGRVMIDDGTPLPEGVVIQRVCNGSAHAEGYTDSKGYFGIELGSKTSAAFQDASEFSAGGGLGPTNGLPGQSRSE